MDCPKCGKKMESDDDFFTGEYYYYCVNKDCKFESDYQGK